MTCPTCQGYGLTKTPRGFDLPPCPTCKGKGSLCLNDVDKARAALARLQWQSRSVQILLKLAKN